MSNDRTTEPPRCRLSLLASIDPSAVCLSICVRRTHAVCPSAGKYGWRVYPSHQLVPITGAEYGTASGGTLFGGAAEAEAHCRVNPRCTAWDTQGNVAFGGVAAYTPTSGVCSYEKDRKWLVGMNEPCLVHAAGV